MTRVWLTGWEWGCCGDPFAVGDIVDFGIARRGSDQWLATMLGTELSATVDAVESHHEEEFADRVHGVVTAIHEVSLEHAERRELRRPGHGAPPDAPAPPPGEEWPFVGREIGGGIIVGSRPSRYIVSSEPVPGSASLAPVSGVRRAGMGDDGAPPPMTAPPDPPPERCVGVAAGWLVDVDEG